MSRKKILKRVCSVLMVVTLVATTVIVDPGHVRADKSGKITSAVMKYNEAEYDVFNETLRVSTDYDETLELDFEISNFSESKYKVEIYSELENGTRKQVWNNKTGKTHAEFELQSLLVDSALRMIVWDISGDEQVQTDDILLGVVVVKGKNHDRYSVSIPTGPEEEFTVDMSKVATGMNFKMMPDSVPMEYKKFPDGRSVIGLGDNADSEQFWEDAKNGKIKTLTFAELQDLYHRTYESLPSLSLEVRWVVVGYAVSMEDDPDTMVGVLQCYTGSTASCSGSGDMFTFSLSLSLDAGVDETFRMTPAKNPSGSAQEQSVKDEFTARWDLNTQVGLELYGGAGNAWVSAGVYGSASITMSLNMYPEGKLNSISEDGETGIKVKFLGITIYTHPFNHGHKDIYPESGKDGTKVYRGNLDLKAAMKDAAKKAVKNGYGNKQYKPSNPQGDQEWLGGTDLTDIDVDEGMVDDDSPYAKKIASNVFPESGIQVGKLQNGKEAVIACVSNNGDREYGNHSELTWMRYDNEHKTITEPMSVCKDIDGDGNEDTGADFDPKLRRNPQNGKIYLVWKRGPDQFLSNRTLTQAAKDYRLCFAEFDEANNKWKNAKVIMDDPDVVIGGFGIGLRHPDQPTDPSEIIVYVCTNPEDDPAGIDAGSEHNFIALKKNDNEEWSRELIDTKHCKITSFDGGYYYFYDEHQVPHGEHALTFTWEGDDGQSHVVVFNKKYEPVVFDGAKNGFFVEGVDNLINLAFTQDGALYTAAYADKKVRQFPHDENESIPEDAFKFIGNITNGAAIVGYLSSKDTSQNVKGYIRNKTGSSWNFVKMTDVDENTNVTYFDGAFFENEEPLIIYTAQKYTVNSSGEETEFVDGVADMYVQAGPVNTHVSIGSAEVKNVEDLGADETQATVSMGVHNNGLEPINKVRTYIRDKNTGDYIQTGEFDFKGDNTLLPGQTKKVEFKFSGDFENPTQYVAAVVGGSDTYPRVDIQSTKKVDIPKGRVRVTQADYKYRNLKHDVCDVTVTSKGPGKKSGKFVYYNSETKDVYKEVPFSDLGPGETLSDELMDPNGKMSDTYPNLRVKVLMDGETLDDAKAQVDDASVYELPAWIVDPNLDDLTPASITKLPTANDTYANGKEQSLLNGDAEVEGGKLQYALGKEEEQLYYYSDDIPTATEPGIYYVWVKVKGDNAHTDSEPQRVKTKIVFPVTFKVVGGAWDDGTEVDKRVDLSRYDDEDLALVLKPEDIPGVGNYPKPGYLKGGAWDVEPPLDKVISKAQTYTYKYKVDPNPPTTPSHKKKVKAPGKTKVKKAIKKKKSPKKISVKLKKVKSAKGYQVAIYKSKKKAKKNKKPIKKKYTKKLKFIVKSKKFKKYKKLYVRARAYKLNGKKKVFGKWSKIKKVKRK